MSEIKKRSALMEAETDKPQSNISGSPSGTKRRRTFNTLSTVGVLLLAPFIAVVLTLYVFQSYEVSGLSMNDTLYNDDRLLVWKTPRTWARITGHQYIPKRGDIIIFTKSGLSNYNDPQNTKQLVKRVIGLPGDRVVYRNSTYTVYNKTHPNGFDPDKVLAYGESGTPLFTAPGTPGVNVTLGPNQLFVSGDHRNDSLDSRYFGPIQTSQVIGRVIVRIYPHPEQF